MIYEAIVIGATFAAAGIAHRYKEKCLVVERRAQGGYEFFTSQLFCEKPLSVYPYFSECDSAFCTEIISVTQKNDGFICLTCGVEGFQSFEGKRIVDTRCSAEMSASKTYDLLIESKHAPSFENLSCEKTSGENRYLLRCPVPLACDFAEAREIAQAIVESFSEEQRLILSADEFNYRIKEGYPKMQDGVLLLPSKAYQNPSLAFEAGFLTFAEDEK